MKAQLIAYHLTQSRFSSFSPNPCEKVIVNFASEMAWKTDERGLFKERVPTMIPGESSCKKPCTPCLWKDRQFQMLFVGPTALAILLWAQTRRDNLSIGYKYTFGEDFTYI